VNDWLSKLENRETLERLKKVAGEWLLNKLAAHEVFTKGGRANKSAMKRTLFGTSALDELFELWRAELGEDFLA